MNIKKVDHILSTGLHDCSVADFEKIFKTYYRQLYLFAYGYVMDEMDADDIVQEAFSIIWERRKRLPEQLELKAYLYSCVKYACLKYFRRLRLTDIYKQRQAEAFVLSLANEPEEDNEIAATVRTAMGKLSPQQLRIVEMHIIQGKKYEEIASELGLSENTVRTHLKRAYKILRENLSFLLPGLSLFGGLI